MSRRVRTALLALVAVVVVVVAAAVAWPDLDGEPASEEAPSPTPTTAPDLGLADVDTSTTAIARAAFCDRVAPEAVTAALGAEPTGATSYADGDRAAVVGRVSDIAHEFSCTWTAGTTIARAWVFAPPVTRTTATALARQAAREEGCTRVAGAPALGSPTAALVCRPGPARVQASFRGLLGDAWLTCSVAGPLEPTEAAQRADRWCVDVLGAVRA
ncbi:hypothetical protein [Nocardioides litoris]|uniref:hypothetical protein n=1 Tax=Nocardioides litoris TaxID=1926648 RepID=UPI001123585E|nr:hypothetical protein [Nocardioides litoris]